MDDETISSAETETMDEISTDPVCGMTVDIEVARQSDLITEFAEREYAFCCAGCRDTFLGHPTAYAVSGRAEP